MSNYRCLDINLYFEQAQNVVDGVQSGDRLNAHEVSHVDQCLCIEHFQPAVLRKQQSVLKYVCWKNLILLQQLFQRPDLFFLVLTYFWQLQKL